MLGAIVGDIVGSRFERANHKSKEFKLFHKDCRFTDDSLMTLAIGKAVMETNPAVPGESLESSVYLDELSRRTIESMRELGNEYPNVGFGKRFAVWLTSDDPRPYRSCGNGAAMRISPVAYVTTDDDELIKLSDAVTQVTHNHDSALRGARAVALAISMARKGASKDQIRTRISEDYYSLDFTIDGIREEYKFDASCTGTVPPAIACFLESTSFEDAIRTAVSIGGDSDTLATITGSIAEAYYGVPEEIGAAALRYLDSALLDIYESWKEFGVTADETEEDEVDGRDLLDLSKMYGSELDVLDERLYDYGQVGFLLEDGMTQKASNHLYEKVEGFLASVPALSEATEKIQKRTEIFARDDLLSDEIKNAIRNGHAELIRRKGDSGAFYMQIRSTIDDLVIGGKKYGKHRKLKDIPMGTKEVPEDINGAMKCLAQQDQLNSITRSIEELTEACENNFSRVIQGQRDDRLAMVLSSRDSLLQGLVMMDAENQRQMLAHALVQANQARGQLAYQVAADIHELDGEKPLKTKKMAEVVHSINSGIAAMNGAVQLSVFASQALGEFQAQQAVVVSHRAFVRQVLLKEISRGERSHTAWDFVVSSGDGRETSEEQKTLPTRLITAYGSYLEAAKIRGNLEGKNDE